MEDNGGHATREEWETERVERKNCSIYRLCGFRKRQTANNASTVKMSWTILLVRDPVDAFPAETRGRNDSAVGRCCVADVSMFVSLARPPLLEF